MKKVILFIVIVFGINSHCFAANNATDIYLLAQTKSTSELSKVENIDVVDPDGNTALCSAIKYDDVDAYTILKSAGANTKHKCIKKIPSEQYQAFIQKVATASKPWSFLRLGKYAWGAIGAGIAVGAVAAMGGGGGGGSSGEGSGETGSNGDINVILNCVHGQQNDTVCLCNAGWTGDLCDTPSICDGYTELSCGNGYIVSGTCQSGETTYVECEQIQCGANATWSGTGCVCNEGYQNWQSGIGCSLTPINCGNNAHQQGTQCACNTGYQNWQNGVGCSLTPINCGANATQQGTQCQCDTGYQNWQSGIGCSLTPINCGNNAHQQGTQCACNTGYQNWQSGIGCSLTPINCGANATQQGTQCQCDTGYQNWQSGIGCSLTPINCGLNAHQNGTQCVCNDGYTGDGITCILTNYQLTTSANVGNANVYGNFIPVNGYVAYSDHGTKEIHDVYVKNTRTGLAYGMHFSGENTIGNAYSLVTNYPESRAVGNITIVNTGGGTAYGMYNPNGSVNNLTASNPDNPEDKIYESTINIYNVSGTAYGIYGKDVVNSGNIYVNTHDNTRSYPSRLSYGIFGNNSLYNTGSIVITNEDFTDYNGTKNKTFDDTFYKAESLLVYLRGYGIYVSGGVAENAGTIDMNNLGRGIGARVGEGGTLTNSGAITIDSGDPFGISVVGDTTNAENTGSIIITSPYNNGGDGMYATGGAVTNSGTISITTARGGEGIFATSGANAINDGYITIVTAGKPINPGTGTIGTYGMRGFTNSTITNNGSITITDTNGINIIYGMGVEEGSSAYNNGIITIDGATNAYGIYIGPSYPSYVYDTSGFVDSGTVVNNGTISVTGGVNSYGIYAQTSGATIINTGTIVINGVSCTGSGCNEKTSGRHIVLNGSTLYNSGLMMAPQMNLNSMGGNVVAGLGSQFVVDNELSGDLNISSELVQSGNQTTYIAENMIDAGDVSVLNVRSASAMFNASLADNGHDVVMQMKDFNELTNNGSLAAFLANNYSNGKGSDLFATLKSVDSVANFNSSLSGLTGLNTFTQFAHEDLSAMREISFSMNNKLFENSTRDNFDISGSTGYFSFSNSHNSGSGQYGISSGKISDNWKLGYGMAMANINTSNNDGMHRQNNLWLFYMPATYADNGYELVLAPKAGFSHSEYSRRGYNSINYEGYIEKRIFGLMNDLRYPLTFGNWTVAPDLAFNAIVYDQSGHEDEQEFSLIIPDDRTVSVETGLGLYTKYEKQLSDGGKFKLNSGLMLYREFGDTYDIKLGMRGMDGTFSLYNNDYDYRGAVSLGFDYMTGQIHLYGNAQYFIDNDNYMNFKGGISYRF